jgi:hypothetical protein
VSKFNININHVPNYTEFIIEVNDLSAMLSGIGISPRYLWDSLYYYVSLQDWNEIFIDTLKNMPAYTVDKFDCDNFALLTMARITEKYKLNGVGIAIGNSPYGYHGWNIFIASPLELLYLEPQTGQIMELAETGYKADYVVWG